ncbi:MAG TPA: hypothetical protein VFG68_02605 [Fimbriiglobus sp.]|nr:hypothetical protein [Fimbriiglobus sp.]
MNLQHLRTFLWLRWRLRVNQLRRGGIANTVVLILLATVVGVAAVVLLVGGFLVGLLALRNQPPDVVLYVWDGVVAGFLFTWAVGLLSDLHRSDALSLDRFLHLPVSPAGAFLVNYLSSWVRLGTILFVPAMTGLALGQTLSHGPAMLLTLPLLAAFLLAVTAVTYQFQGWLASLMTNPRRRRTVVVLVTFGFILVFQLPNLVNLARVRHQPSASQRAPTEMQKELSRELQGGKITVEEYQRRYEENQQRQREQATEESRREWEQAGQTARLINLVLPPGWLPLGAANLIEGHFLPALLGTLGLGAVGALSLWRAYRTTIRLYTGQTGCGESKTATRAVPAEEPARPRLMEWRLPGVSEYAAAVAVAGFRSMTRAPEAKMMLLSPLIMVVVFGSMVLTASTGPPGPVRPLMASGAAAFVFLMAIQLVGNQFGYDRAGFRALVLSPVPRREVLLGKNLAAVPLVLGLAVTALVLVACLYPMRPDHVLATFTQIVSLYLLFCLLANALSIVAPIPVAAGSIQPSHVRFVPVLMHMGFMMVFSLVVALTLVPLGVELLLAELGGVRGWPAALGLSLVLLVAVWFGYRKALTWEGDWLAAREQAILEVVTSKTE